MRVEVLGITLLAQASGSEPSTAYNVRTAVDGKEYLFCVAMEMVDVAGAVVGLGTFRDHQYWAVFQADHYYISAIQRLVLAFHDGLPIVFPVSLTEAAQAGEFRVSGAAHG